MGSMLPAPRCWYTPGVGSFVEALDAAAARNQSLLCVGLDPWRPSMPVDGIAAFNRAIIEATRDLVCAYKPNFAFYEAEGLPGLEALMETIEAAQAEAPVILDAKRGDMGNTARAYAKAAFETWGAGAVTVNPYLGGDSIQPFLAYADRCVFVLVRTSNPGAEEFQSLVLGEQAASEEGGAGGAAMRLYERAALQARRWNAAGNVGLVVGATAPRELARVRELCPDMPMLVPGVGAQGGDLEASVRNGADVNGRRVVINASRSVLYASRGADFAEAARAEALRLRDAINAELERMGKGWT